MDHLQELLHAEASLLLSEEEMTTLRKFSQNPIQYIKLDNPIVLVRALDPENFIPRIVNDLRDDMAHPEALTGAANLAPVYRKTSKP